MYVPGKSENSYQGSWTIQWSLLKGQCIDVEELTGIISNDKCGTNAIPDAYGVCHCPDGFVESLDRQQCFRCESITGPKSARNRSKFLNESIWYFYHWISM